MSQAMPGGTEQPQISKAFMRAPSNPKSPLVNHKKKAIKTQTATPPQPPEPPAPPPPPTTHDPGAVRYPARGAGVACPCADPGPLPGSGGYPARGSGNACPCADPGTCPTAADV